MDGNAAPADVLQTVTTAAADAADGWSDGTRAGSFAVGPR